MSTTRPPFPRLLSSYQLGGLTLRNRVVNLPQGTAYTNRGRVEDEDVLYQQRRARGGVGLIITGGTAAQATSQTRARGFIEAYNPDVVPSLRRRSDIVHASGAHLIGQVFDLGRLQAAETMTTTPLAPSAIRSEDTRYAPMAMGMQHIAEVVEGFRLSARHLMAGGYDGIEIHGAHGYLLAQFLSSVTNHRDDDYGGDLHGRSRLLLEVLRAVRAEVGATRVVGVRLSVADEVPGGTTPEDCAETLRIISGEVALDYVSLAVGVRGGYVKDSSVAEGIALTRIASVKKTTDLPVIASQRIRTPEQAEAALAAGQTDLIGLARPLTADPEWVAKAASGESRRIRLCIGDLQDCRSHLTGGLRCIVNPDVGREVVLRGLPKARPVLGQLAVVGGGPAGLETARRAAEAGHAVTLYEAAKQVGGQLLLAASAPGRAELLDLVRWQTTELERLGVTILVGAPMTTREMTDLDADVVIAATGATGAPLPAAYDIPGMTAETVWDVLQGEGERRHSARIVLVDDGTGDWPLLTAAQSLRAGGHDVVILTPGATIFRSIPAESIPGLRRRMHDSGIRWHTGTHTIKPTTGRVTFTRDGMDERSHIPADAVVVETGRRPVDALWRAADGVYSVGDCRTPRGIANAIGDAQQLEWNLRARLTRPASKP